MRCHVQKTQFCVNCSANIILSELPIGDLATQYFHDAGLFYAGQLQAVGMNCIVMATGVVLKEICPGITNNILGKYGVFQKVLFSNERLNLLRNCPNCLVLTMVLQGGSRQFIVESEQSFHNVLMVVR